MFNNINLMLEENEGIVKTVTMFICAIVFGAMIVMGIADWNNVGNEGMSNLTYMVEECEADVEELEESVYYLIELDNQLNA